MTAPDKRRLIAELRARLRRLEQAPGGTGPGGAAAGGTEAAVLPFGCAALDAALPGGGLALGALHEVLGAGPDEQDGAVAAAFAAGILGRLAARGPVLWCLARDDLYAPGLAACGLDPDRLIVARAGADIPVLWAMEEGLRTPALAGVLGEVETLGMTASRRLQLAAQASGVTALVLRRRRFAAARPGRAGGVNEGTTAAVTRWRVAAAASDGAEPWPGRPRWRVDLLRCRGGAATAWPASWMVEACDATGHVSVVAELADRPAEPATAGDRILPFPALRTG